MKQKLLLKQNKHDRYVQELCKKIQNRYDYLILDYEIGKSKRTLGQVDIAGVKDEKTDLYEVKCSYRIHKAQKQLKRAQKIMKVKGKLYFYCGSSGVLEQIND
ncbi:MAG: hypothetical protein KatS3mg002_1439 [Candidatus Woesearchaeota archaeon]|nr:MAG: hypothetical protein KatS3mg002_1439 [Candidatus Woesearchaeota archaeon]